jgi:uncharacterized membrane protein YgcG
MASRDLGRRLDTTAVEVGTLRVADSPRGRPTRDLRSLETARAATRSAFERAGARGTAPEIRTDSNTPPQGARRRDSVVERDERGVAPRSGRERTSEEERPRGNLPETVAPRRVPAEGRSESRTPEARGTSDPRSGADRSRVDTDPRTTRERDRGSEHGESPAPKRDGDRDVIRQLFKPLSEPRSAAPRDGGEGRSRPRTERPESSGGSSSNGGSSSSGGSSRGGGSSSSGGSSRGGAAPRAQTPPPRTESRPPAAPARPQGSGDAERRKPPKDNH